MKFDWNQFIGKILNVTMLENYGVVYSNSKENPVFYEIVFKTGKLTSSFEEGLLLEAQRDQQTYNIFIPYNSIKCVEIF